MGLHTYFRVAWASEMEGEAGGGDWFLGRERGGDVKVRLGSNRNRRTKNRCKGKNPSPRNDYYFNKTVLLIDYFI